MRRRRTTGQRLAGCAGLVCLLISACGEPPTEPAGEEPPAPKSLEIVCHEDGTTSLSSDRVAAQPDGIHFTVENRSGESASINGFAVDVGKGTSANVAHTPPGTVKVACWPFSKHRGEEPEPHPVEVLDPENLWVDPELDCPPGPTNLAESAIRDFVDTSKSEFDDPVAAARDYFDNFQEEDVVEIAGYPEGEPPVVRVARGEYVVASVGFLRADDGGVIIETHQLCAGAGIKTDP